VIKQDRTVSETVIVQLQDRREFRAKVLGVDAGTDIAVLKIEGRNLPYARFADSEKARVGDVVFAIGNPLDAGLTVTSGIVSALGRSGKLGMGMAFEDFIQTDAAINPGNSGGPLIDFEGRLLGMNTAIKSGTGLSVGLGYSIPSNLITAVALDLANQGRVVRGLIGVQGEDLSVAEATKLSLGQAGGVRLVLVSDELPAAKAGLKVGDIVVGLNGKPVENWNELRLEISRRRPGEVLTLNYIREGRGSLARLTVAERPLDR
jgi:S1-C subfamily serine protease